MTFEKPFNKRFLWQAFPYLTLLVLAVLGFWQVALLQHPLKWDLMDQAFPWKYFIGESLQNHILPLWNPYQHCGYPIHADPQSSALYPVVWFFGYFWGYSIYILSLDFTLHIFLAGTGMFILGKILGFRRNVALIMGIGYMFSGFFVGNAQHFMWIISATWLPWVIGSYISLSVKRTLRKAVTFSLLMFLLITGGYPAFTMVLLYFLIILFVFYAVTINKNEGRSALLSFLKYNAVALMLTIFVSAVMLVSVFELMPYLSRTQGLSLKDALFGPFSAKSLISFIIPFGAVNYDLSGYGTDMSMANGYFGIIPFVFFVSAFFIRKSAIVKLFLFWGLFMLAAALGDVLPVRSFLYNYVPFFTIFRFPSLLRVFVIISFLVVSGFALNHFLTFKSRRVINLSILAVFLLIVIVTGFNIAGEYIDLGGFLKDGGIFTFSKTSVLPRQIFFQAVVQFVFLAILLLLINKFENRASFTPFLTVLVALDLIFALQLNAPYTVYNETVTQKQIDEKIKSLPKGFPIPEMKPVIGNRDRGALSFKPLWRNLNIFYKQLAWDGYNPMELKGFETLEDSLTVLLKSVIENPPAYFAETVLPFDSVSRAIESGEIDKGTVYLKPASFKKIHFIVQGCGDNSVEFSSFSPVEAEFRVETDRNKLLVYLQNYYYGWKAFVDGKEYPVLKADGTFLSVEVPKGSHIIGFEYKPVLVTTGFYFSLFFLIISIVFLITPFGKRRQG
jgi:hypothetical protein